MEWYKGGNGRRALLEWGVVVAIGTALTVAVELGVYRFVTPIMRSVAVALEGLGGR